MRRVPVDSALGAEASVKLEDVLAPLAARVRRLRVWNQAIIVLALSVAALLAAQVALGQVRVAPAMGALLLLAVARQRRTDMLWEGRTGVFTIGADPIAPVVLPKVAVQVLAELRTGQRKMYWRRGDGAGWTEVFPQQLKGPFGPLLLSHDPAVQALALWSWYGGSRLSVEVEADEGAIPPAIGNALPVWVDPSLGLPPEALSSLLAAVLGCIETDASKALKYDAMMTANELLQRGIGRESVKALLDATCRALQTADGEPVVLHPATRNGLLHEPVVLNYRKHRVTPYGRKLGLRGSDSVSWLEDMLTGRYPNVSEKLQAMAVRLEA